MTFNFKIGVEPYTFSVNTETIENDQVLTTFTATDGDNNYNCSIQMVNQLNGSEVKCCTGTTCTDGPC